MFETSDLGIAAYLIMKGIKLLSASKGRGRYEFVFEDPDGVCRVYAIEFINSDCSKFDSHLKNLKNILNSSS